MLIHSQPTVASRGLHAGDDLAAKLDTAEESHAMQVADLRAELAKLTDSVAHGAERERERAAAQSEVVKRVSAELEATKPSLR